MRQAIDQLSSAFAVAAASCVLVMMLLTGADIAIRWTTGRSLAGAQEVTESLMVALVYLGLAFALKRREHVSVSIFTSSLPVRVAAGVRLVGLAIMVLIVAWMLWRTGLQAWKSYQIGEVRFGLLQVPIWPARAAIPIGLAAFLFQALTDVADRFETLRTGESLDNSRHTPML